MLGFSTVYKLTSESHNLPPEIVLGVKVVESETDKGPVVSTQMIRAGSDYGRKISGKLLENRLGEGDEVVRVESNETASDGQKIVWVLRPLSLANWVSMADHIDGFSLLQDKFRSDEELQAFYIADFLPDYWAESGT